MSRVTTRPIRERKNISSAQHFGPRYRRSPLTITSWLASLNIPLGGRDWPQVGLLTSVPSRMTTPRNPAAKAHGEHYFHVHLPPTLTALHIAQRLHAGSPSAVIASKKIASA